MSLSENEERMDNIKHKINPKMIRQFGLSGQVCLFLCFYRQFNNLGPNCLINIELSDRSDSSRGELSDD